MAHISHIALVVSLAIHYWPLTMKNIHDAIDQQEPLTIGYMLDYQPFLALVRVTTAIPYYWGTHGPEQRELTETVGMFGHYFDDQRNHGTATRPTEL